MAIGRLIDVSSNNHPNGAPIDWAQVANAGVTAVFIKATSDEGGGYTNPYYAADVLEALHAGISVCAYHFVDPDTAIENPVAEAQRFAQIAGTKARMLDYETNTDAQWARTFLQTLGWARDQCITYGSSSTLKDFYQQLPSMAFPAAYGQFYPGWGVCWQFTDAAQIPGIQGDVDESRWYGNEAQYDSLFQTDVPPPGPPQIEQGDEVEFNQEGGQDHLYVYQPGRNRTVHYWQASPGTGGANPPPNFYDWHSEVLPEPA